MGNHEKPRTVKTGSEIPPAPGIGNAVDATGLWFTVVVLCAVLAAGVIVYRTGNADLRMASNDVAARPVMAAVPDGALTRRKID
jgi:uncharacterized lipoprotein YmbA